MTANPENLMNDSKTKPRQTPLQRSNHLQFFVRAACRTAGFLSLAIALGCSTDGLVGLQGTLLIDNAPAPAGLQLEFIPVDKSLLPAYATTDSEGKYVAKSTFTKDGLQPGEYIARLVPGGGGSGDATPRPGDASEPQSGRRFPYGKRYYEEISRFVVPGRGLVVDLTITTED